MLLDVSENASIYSINTYCTKYKNKTVYVVNFLTP